MSNSSEVDGGRKRRIELGENDAGIDELFDYGNNYEEDDDSTVDNNASVFMGRISKDVTAAHQVKLMFQDYDERKPKATETTNVLINLFNFLAALAGDNVRTGVTSDLKAVYGRAEEFFVNTYENSPKKNDAQTKFFQYFPKIFDQKWPPFFSSIFLA